MPASDTFPSVIYLFSVKLDPMWFNWCRIFNRKRWNPRTAGLKHQETRQLIGGHLGLLPVFRTVGCFASGAGCSSFHLFRNVFFWDEGRTRTTIKRNNVLLKANKKKMCTCGWKVLVSECQQKKSGIHRKDLIAVPAAIPASSPTATVPITSSKGSLWTTSWWLPTENEIQLITCSREG